MKYKHMITYQYFTKNWLGVEQCHIDYVLGLTLESAKAALSERRKAHPGLQVLVISEVAA